MPAVILGSLPGTWCNIRAGAFPRRTKSYPVKIRHACAFLWAAGNTASIDLSKFTADIQATWPAWYQNACRRLSQAGAGQIMHGPTPAEATVLLHGIAMQCQRLSASARYSLTREREVKGLVEALQVTPPRPCSADYLGVYSTAAQYPSLAALECLSAGAISDCIWALAVLGGGAVYESETDALIQVGQKHRWQGLTPLQAANVCWGLATARHCTPALGNILDGRMAERLCELSPRQMTALLWGCAILLHQPHAALQRLSKYFKADDVTGQTGLSKFGGRQVATCGWALSVLQQQGTPLFSLIWAEICSRPRASFSNKAVLMQLHQVALEANTAGVEIALYDKQGLLEAAKLVWDTEVVNKRSKQGSYYARDIVTTVIGLGLHYVEEDASTGCAVDVSLPQLKIAIEADGPSHRSRNTRQPLGPTLMKQRHLQAAGWQLITVAHDDWDKLQGPSQKLQYLEDKLGELLA